jgi:hypothetical protein
MSRAKRREGRVIGGRRDWRLEIRELEKWRIYKVKVP